MPLISIYEHYQKIIESFYLKDYNPNTPSVHKIKRLIHGAMHVTRAAISIPILANLRRKYGDKEALKLDNEKSVLLQLMMLFHDSCREDEGEDKWDRPSAAEAYKYLISIGTDKDIAKLLAEAAANKDTGTAPKNNIHYELKENSKGNIEWIPKLINENYERNIFQKLIHDADCLEIIRARADFYQEHLDISKDIAINNPEAKNDLDHLRVNYRRFIAITGDEFLNIDEIKKEKYELSENCYLALEKEILELNKYQLDVLYKLYGNNKLLSQEELQKVEMQLYDHEKYDPTKPMDIKQFERALQEGQVLARGIMYPEELSYFPRRKDDKIKEGENKKEDETYAHLEFRKIFRKPGLPTRTLKSNNCSKNGNPVRSTTMIGYDSSIAMPVGLLIKRSFSDSKYGRIGIKDFGSGYNNKQESAVDSSRLKYILTGTVKENFEELFENMKTGHNHGFRNYSRESQLNLNEIETNLNSDDVFGAYLSPDENLFHWPAENEKDMMDYRILQVIYIQQEYKEASKVFGENIELPIYKYSSNYKSEPFTYDENTIVVCWGNYLYDAIKNLIVGDGSLYKGTLYEYFTQLLQEDTCIQFDIPIISSQARVEKIQMVLGHYFQDFSEAKILSKYYSKHLKDNIINYIAKYIANKMENDKDAKHKIERSLFSFDLRFKQACSIFYMNTTSEYCIDTQKIHEATEDGMSEKSRMNVKTQPIKRIEDKHYIILIHALKYMPPKFISQYKYQMIQLIKCLYIYMTTTNYDIISGLEVIKSIVSNQVLNSVPELIKIQKTYIDQSIKDINDTFNIHPLNIDKINVLKETLTILSAAYISSIKDQDDKDNMKIIYSDNKILGNKFIDLLNRKFIMNEPFDNYNCQRWKQILIFCKKSKYANDKIKEIRDLILDYKYEVDFLKNADSKEISEFLDVIEVPKKSLIRKKHLEHANQHLVDAKMNQKRMLEESLCLKIEEYKNLVLENSSIDDNKIYAIERELLNEFEKAENHLNIRDIVAKYSKKDIFNIIKRTFIIPSQFIDKFRYKFLTLDAGENKRKIVIKEIEEFRDIFYNKLKLINIFCKEKRAYKQIESILEQWDFGGLIVPTSKESNHKLLEILLKTIKKYTKDPKQNIRNFLQTQLKLLLQAITDDSGIQDSIWIEGLSDTYIQNERTGLEDINLIINGLKQIKSIAKEYLNEEDFTTDKIKDIKVELNKRMDKCFYDGIRECIYEIYQCNCNSVYPLKPFKLLCRKFHQFLQIYNSNRDLFSNIDIENISNRIKDILFSKLSSLISVNLFDEIVYIYASNTETLGKIPHDLVIDIFKSKNKLARVQDVIDFIEIYRRNSKVFSCFPIEVIQELNISELPFSLLAELIKIYKSYKDILGDIPKSLLDRFQQLLEDSKSKMLPNQYNHWNLKVSSNDDYSMPKIIDKKYKSASKNIKSEFLDLVSNNDFYQVERSLKKYSGLFDIFNEEYNYSVLFGAMKNEDLFKMMISDEEFDINSKYDQEKTILMVAVENNYNKILEELIKRGADIELVDKRGHSAIYYAVTNNNKEATRILLQAKAQVNKDILNKMKKNGWKALIELHEKIKKSNRVEPEKKVIGLEKTRIRGIIKKEVKHRYGRKKGKSALII